MILKAGESYTVELIVTIEEDVDEAVIDATITNALYNDTPTESLTIGHYEELTI